MKLYDKAYYDKWYRETPVMTPDARMYRAILCLAVTGRVLGRSPRTVLDVGCGEMLWGESLRAFLPELDYTGADPSPYAVSLGAINRPFNDLPEYLYDLILCVDVLHYLSDKELSSGLPRMFDRMGGVAYLPVATSTDQTRIGDTEGFHDRPAPWYRREFQRAGLQELGLGFWTRPTLAARLSSMEVIP